jgi:hypothetical protein
MWPIRALLTFESKMLASLVNRLVECLEGTKTRPGKCCGHDADRATRRKAFDRVGADFDRAAAADLGQGFRQLGAFPVIGFAEKLKGEVKILAASHGRFAQQRLDGVSYCGKVIANVSGQFDGDKEPHQPIVAKTRPRWNAQGLES